MVLFSCGKSPQKKEPTVHNSQTDSINSLSDSLRSLDVPLGQPQPGDWLYNNQEKGQTFQQFTSFAPLKPDSIRNIFYLQPIGKFNEFEQNVIQKLSNYLYYFFYTEVQLLAPLSGEIINGEAIRFSSTGNHQVLTYYLLDSILAPQLP